MMKVDRRRGHKVSNIIKHLILGLVAVIMLLPFFWVISTAFKTQQEAIAFPPTFIPKDPTLDNFKVVLKDPFFKRYFINSLIICGTVVVGGLFICSLTGYVLAKFNFRSFKIFSWLIVGKLMVPTEVLMIPLYLLVIRLGWQDTLLALIVPTELVSAFGIFMMEQFIETFPDSIIDSARIDGCGDFRIYWNIVLPNMTHAFLTLGILLFVWSWSMFTWPLIVIDSPEKMPIQVGLERFSSAYYTQYGPKMAGVLLSILPVLVIFLLFQRKILENVALSGMKE